MQQGSNNSTRWIPQLILAVCLALIVILGLQARALRGYQRQVQRMKTLPHAGQWVPTVRVSTIVGDSITIGETTAGRAQVLIAFSTTCEFCMATIPHWKRLTDSLTRDPRSRFDVVWLSASSWDSTRSYASRHGIVAPVAKLPSAKLARVYQIKVVPLTLVIDRWGRVEHAHASLFKNAAALDSVFVAAYRAAAADSLLASASPPRTARR
jgi:peroxiredoxin